jgi:hypothetical protein
MNIHKNARLTPLRREEMALAVMEGRLSQAQAGSQYAVTAKVVKRWGERHRAEGRAGMADRSSRPRCSPKATAGAVAERIVALRRQRLHGQAHRKCGRRLADGGEPGAGRDCRG